MNYKSILVVTVAVSALCRGAPSIAAETNERPAAITFEYKDGKISQPFIEWVAKYGARTPVEYDPKSTVEDYVKVQCGSAASSNVQLFKRSLLDQNVSVDAQGSIERPMDGMLFLPPCLPSPSSSPAPRIVLRGERLWDYYPKTTKPIGSVLNAVTPVSPFDLFADESILNASTPANRPDETSGIQEITARYLKTNQIKPVEPGEAAWNVFLAANELKRIGYSDEDVFEAINDIAPEYTSPTLQEGVAAAIQKWSGAYQISSYGWENAINDGADNKVSQQNKVTWLDPKPSPKKDPTKLQIGDIVLGSTAPIQSVEIPVDYASLSTSSSADAVQFLKRNPPPAPTDGESISSIDVSLADTQPFEDMPGDACDGASYKFWGSETFARDFASAALRTRVLAYRKGVQEFSASVVVVDSGFVFAKDVGAFREGAFTQTAGLLHEQEASRALGAKRVHGTIVAGLALGGPELWGMPSALGLNIKITPATIFRDRLQNQVLVPVFEPQWLMNAIGGGGDIFNISFATRDESRMRAFEDYVGRAAGKLFVVAAGNNNLNNDNQGVDINDTQLYPQRFGGNENGPNVITVAAYDGRGLAKFSNFSETYVSIAAPGCAVTSWAPNDDDSAYVTRRVTGTSFSTPIVAHVAAIIKAMMPQRYSQPSYVRARILAGADLIPELKGVEDGRLLNPIKAVSLYEDVIELDTGDSRRLVTGSLQTKLAVNDLCEGAGEVDGQSQLLKFARDPTPADGKDSIVYLMRNGILDNKKTCKHKPGYVAFIANTGEQMVVNLDQVVDMVMKVPDDE
ncbi:hypothetical protein ELH43_36600 [Rhizobium ruizarguesonis]|uniref:S8 family serine peptidase n=1 Tax=Rhizobium ruizarguesonis TaxID=2081791 RepID=UPI00102FCC7C|nr:S8 family serine peptidase [Rhizobium ruizarguesonis]TBB60665.1 hypothetical protein ELH43_36600 [Rhizobium ruizarguesonis]